MNLSIWHCFVLYCYGDTTIERLAEKADLSVLLLNQAKNVEKWDSKKAQFLKLSPKQKTSLDILELFFGEFQEDDAKKAFVQKVIDRLKNPKKSSKSDKAEIKLQKISELTEFGMSHEQATAFIEEVEKILARGKTTPSDNFSDLMPKELSIQDKLDIVNHSYKYLVSGKNSQLANCQKILEDAIKFYAGEIAALKATKGKLNDFDEIALRQRTLSCNAQSLSKLIKLYIENFSS
ncbi:hypothetical protein LC609_01290 [Nostoc sp. XA013]|nr:hypothetical protein [Nostoc sp. XA013]